MEKGKCSFFENWKEPKFILTFLAIIVLGIVVVVSILRDGIIDNNENQITVMGRGEAVYQPDVAFVNLGVQIDKEATAQKALSKMNEKINSIMKSLSEMGVLEDNITTQNYSLHPQYDYKDGSSDISGYNANQQIVIKVENIDEERKNLEDIIAKASESGANQVLGINFEISDINDLKQKARIEAIKDARSKAQELVKAAGIRKLGKVISWYENMASDSEKIYRDGLGAGGLSASSVSQPSVPAGNQKITIEMGVIYEVK